MKQLSKRLVSILLSLTLLLSLLPAAIPTKAESLDYLTYTISNGEVTITGCAENPGALVIPSTIEGYPVTAIAAEAFVFTRDLHSVKIPDSVTSIGAGAFAECLMLVSVELPEGITHIESGTFRNCNRLYEIDIPQSVTWIGDSAFEMCGMNSMTIPDGVTGIGKRAFYGCSTLYSITFGSKLASIGEYAFEECDYLCEVIIPESVTEIGRGAFSNCKLLYTASILAGVTTVEDHLFSGCTSLETVSLPDSVTTIGDGAFYNCSALTAVDLPDNLTGIGDSAFWRCSALTSVDLPDAVTAIGNQAFAGCSGLRSITIPETVTTIGDQAFSGCTKLEAIQLPDGITELTGTFYECAGLSSITIPADVTLIGHDTFGQCQSLEQITFLGDAPEFETEGSITSALPQEGELPPGVVVGPLGPSDDSVWDDFPEGGEETGEDETKPETVYDIFTGVTATVYYPANNPTWTEEVRQNYGGSLTWVPVCNEHTLGDQVTVEKANTCTEDGIMSGVCESCGITISVTIPAGHTPNEWGTVKEPSATEEGLKEQRCTLCNELLASEAIPQSGNGKFGPLHITIYDGEVWITDCDTDVIGKLIIPEKIYGCPVVTIENDVFFDCDSLVSITVPRQVEAIGILSFAGRSLQTIYFCGDKPWWANFSHEEDPWNEHYPFEGVYATAYYHAGAEGWSSATSDDWTGGDGQITFVEVDHIFGEHIPNSDATCTADGTKTAICGGCDATDTVTDTGSATGHTPGEWITVKEPTAAEDGVKEQRCATCSELLSSEVLQKLISGKCGDNMTWCLDPNTGVLTISGTGEMYNTNAVPWAAYAAEITTVRVEEGVETIRDYAFNECTALTKIDLPESLVSIGSYAFFNCSSLADVTLPERLTTLGSHCFYSCKSLTTIEIPEGVTELPKLLFTNCSALASVTLSQSVCAIGEKAFFGCKSMTELTLPQSLTTVGLMAFYGCAGLTELTLPHNVTSIGSQTFYKCTALAELTFTGDAPTIAEDAFLNVTATAKYPAESETWTDVIRSSYGGTITWEPWSETVVQPTLKLKAPTLEFKDMITVNAFFTAENIEDVVEMGMITYSYKSDVVSVETAEHRIPGAAYIESSGRYLATSQGIHAKYLGDTVYLAVYAELKDGTYAYTILAPYSPVDYATNQIKNSTNVQLKQLCAAMLNYGAEAQLFFGHNTSALANASLTDEQKALPESYREDMVSAVPAASKEKQGEFANNKGFAKRTPSISFEGAFCINYFFTPNYAPVDGITMYYWNEADYNAVDVLTAENASGSFKMDGTGMGQYTGNIEGIAAKALSEAVYVSAVYSDGTTTWTSGVLGYSIGAYCSSQASKGTTISDLAMATAVYGYQAKQYFP